MRSKMEVLRMVSEERNRQNAKWGFPQDNTPFEWMSILTEEVGELAEAINNVHLGSGPQGDQDEIVYEAIQVAAVAVSIVEHLS